MHFSILSLSSLLAMAVARGVDIHIDLDGSEHADSAVPKCYWDGTSPFCAGGCQEGYSECARSTSGDGATCWTGYKAYCCRGDCSNSAIEAAETYQVAEPKKQDQLILDSSEIAGSGCYWDGTSPFCAGGCEEGYTECGRSATGNGATCWTGVKAYCCKNSCPSNVKFDSAAPKTPHIKGLAALKFDGDYDDVCDHEEELLCCPPGAAKNKQCKCIKPDHSRNKNHRSVLNGNSDNDLCSHSERLCCNPGAESNEECACVPVKE